MKDTSILIPTYKRPHLLLAALESVARQTAVDRIGEIVVIENGSDRRSEKVCQKFPGLPIKYIFRNPTVPVSKLTVVTLSETSLPNVALLHDDDWWLDFHLERSLEKLDTMPELSAVYASYFVTESENSWFQEINGNFTAWFGNDQHATGDTRILDFKQVLITSILQAGFHMSSLVYRGSVIGACFEAFSDGNEYDNDRTLAVELSRQGNILFHDTPSIVVRNHPGQDNRQTKRAGKASYWFNRNTRRMIQQAIDASIDIRSELDARVSRPGFSADMALRCIRAEDYDPLVEASLLSPSLLKTYRCAKWRNGILRTIFSTGRLLGGLLSRGKSNI